MSDRVPLSAAELRSIPLLRGLSDDELTKLVALFERVPNGGATLFENADLAESVYLLTKGEVVLSQGDEDTHHLHPPAVIGELGPLTGLHRNSTASVSPGSEVWAANGASLQAFFHDNPRIGLRFQKNLLDVCGEKIDRDQNRLRDMRANLIRTQRAMKEMRDYLLESEDTAVSEKLHDAVAGLIEQNRRVNYRVKPPSALEATLRIEGDGKSAVVQISRTHISFTAPDTMSFDDGQRVTGVLSLSGPEIPISGKVLRTIKQRVDLELDLLIDDYASGLEGYLTRVQMLDFLV